MQGETTMSHQPLSTPLIGQAQRKHPPVHWAELRQVSAEPLRRALRTSKHPVPLPPQPIFTPLTACLRSPPHR